MPVEAINKKEGESVAAKKDRPIVHWGEPGCHVATLAHAEHCEIITLQKMILDRLDQIKGLVEGFEKDAVIDDITTTS